MGLVGPFIGSAAGTLLGRASVTRGRCDNFDALSPRPKLATATLGLALALALAWLGAPACGGDDPADGESDPADETTDGESETGEPAAAGDVCETTELLVEAPTATAATLRHASPSSLGDPCGATGPVVFVRLGVAGRVDLTLAARGRDYVPRLAVSLPGCVASEVDPQRLLGCADALPLTLFDIGPDTELLVAVGIAEADPALVLPPPASEDDPDPLDFELDIAMRAVLAEGQGCGSSLGRCESGTVCLPAVEGEGEDGIEVERCRRPPADSCAAPGLLALPEPGSALELEIPPDEPHSDAHAHACTGARRLDRVDRLMLPPALPAGATLRVRADDPRVGLALRRSSCLPEDALACTPAGLGSETVLSWGSDGLLAQLAAAGDGPLLFVELPPADVDEPPGVTSLSVEIVEN